MEDTKARRRAEVLLVQQMDNGRMLVAPAARQHLLRDARRALRRLFRPRLELSLSGVEAASEALMAALGASWKASVCRRLDTKFAEFPFYKVR